MNKKQEKTFLVRVKERVDFIYGILVECPEGYHGGFTQDALTGEVVRALISRGVIKREKDNTRPRLVFIYKWNAHLAPTKTLYTNIMVDVRESRKKYTNNKKSNKANDIPATIVEDVAPIVEEKPKEIEAAEKIQTLDLRGVPSQELWDELKARGYYIDDNRLAVTRKEYLE